MMSGLLCEPLRCDKCGCDYPTARCLVYCLIPGRTPQAFDSKLITTAKKEIVETCVEQDEGRSADDERLSDLKAEVWRCSITNAVRRRQVNSLERKRDRVEIDRRLATEDLAAALRQKKQFKMQACFWRGCIAIRERKLKSSFERIRTNKIDIPFLETWKDPRRRELRWAYKRLKVKEKQQWHEIRKYCEEHADDIDTFLTWRNHEIIQGRPVLPIDLPMFFE